MKPDLEKTMQTIDALPDDVRIRINPDYKMHTDSWGERYGPTLCDEGQIPVGDLKALVAELRRSRVAVRYALATFRALDEYTFEDSDHGLLIEEAVKKLEALEPGKD